MPVFSSTHLLYIKRSPVSTPLCKYPSSRVKEELLHAKQVMDPELRNAAINGDVGFLALLRKDDPRLLIFFDCTPIGAETPLHVALLHGRLEFATAILKLSPELARMPNERGSYPLHLASARGYVDVVKELLKIDPSLSCLCDKEGRTALASAALNEKVEVLKELYPVYKEQVGFRKKLRHERKERILHICVEHNLLEMAEVLVELDEELVKKRDDNGNTPLHLAVAKQNTQMQEFLMSKMDWWTVKQKNLRGLKAGNIINNGYGGRLSIFEKWDDWYKKDEKWINELRNTLMLLATLIVTVSFQSGVNPPGGFWQDDGENLSPSNPPNGFHEPGTVIHNNSRKFRLFMYFDMIAFAASLTIILSLVSGFPLRHRFTTGMLVISVWIALTSMAVAFLFATQLIIINEKVLETIPYVLGVWMGLMVLVLLSHCVIFVGFLVKTLRQGGTKLLDMVYCGSSSNGNNTDLQAEDKAPKKDEECGKH